MFETALIESRRSKRPTRRLLTVPAAAGLHAALIAGAVAAQLWAVDEVPEPVIQAILYPGLLGPPPGPKAETQTPSEPRSTKPPERREFAQPTAVNEALPPPRDEPDDSFAGILVAGGLPGAGGSPGGDGNRGEFTSRMALPDPEPVEPTDHVYIVGGEITPPVTVHRVDPVYPEVARVARRQGIVIIQAIVDAGGNVTDAHVLSDRVGFGAGESALQAVRSWRYEPALYRGVRVPVYLTITIQFTLH